MISPRDVCAFRIHLRSMVSTMNLIVFLSLSVASFPYSVDGLRPDLQTGNDQESSPKKLASCNIKRSGVSVSGISSGAAFAVQFHVAFSKEIKGVDSIAGIPYHCSEGQLYTALGKCMTNPSSISINQLVSYTDSKVHDGSIDSTSDLKNSRVFIWSGSSDTVVNPISSQKIESFYHHYGATIKREQKSQAKHTFPTKKNGRSCSSLGSPYIGKCDYDGAYEILNHIYGNLTRPSTTVNLIGKFLEFDQTEFSSTTRRKRFWLDSWYLIMYENYQKLMGQFLLGRPNALSNWLKFISSLGGRFVMPGLSLPSTDSMDSRGFVYIPSGCLSKNNECQLHVAFHGCKQGRIFIQEEFARTTGYNEVGELNNIIILYPQITTSTIANPNGCWDWWAYTSKSYDTKSGVQMKIIKKMIDRLGGW